MEDIQITFQHWHFENRSLPTYLSKLILNTSCYSDCRNIFINWESKSYFFRWLHVCRRIWHFYTVLELDKKLPDQTMAVGITERVETFPQQSNIARCFFKLKWRQISSGFAHIETSRELRLVDKLFPGLVDWNYKTSQMHCRTLLKVEVKNISHLWSSSKPCRIIFRTDFPQIFCAPSLTRLLNGCRMGQSD